MLNLIFAETNELLQLTSSSKDNFFTHRNASSFDFDENGNLADERNETHDLYGEDAKQEDDHLPACNKSKFVVAPHKKAKKRRSNKHGLSAIARGITAATAVQYSRFERQLQEIRENKKKQKMLGFPERDGEREMQHDDRMIQLFSLSLGANAGTQTTSTPMVAVKFCTNTQQPARPFSSLT